MAKLDGAYRQMVSRPSLRPLCVIWLRRQQLLDHGVGAIL